MRQRPRPSSQNLLNRFWTKSTTWRRFSAKTEGGQNYKRPYGMRASATNGEVAAKKAGRKSGNSAGEAFSASMNFSLHGGGRRFSFGLVVRLLCSVPRLSLCG